MRLKRVYLREKLFSWLAQNNSKKGLLFCNHRASDSVSALIKFSGALRDSLCPFGTMGRSHILPRRNHRNCQPLARKDRHRRTYRKRWLGRYAFLRRFSSRSGFVERSSTNLALQHSPVRKAQFMGATFWGVCFKLFYSMKIHEKWECLCVFSEGSVTSFPHGYCWQSHHAMKLHFSLFIESVVNSSKLVNVCFFVKHSRLNHFNVRIVYHLP